MAENAGVSHSFLITKQNLKQNTNGNIHRFTDEDAASPPVNTNFFGYPSYAITKWINPYPDIAFQKIVLPQWGNDSTNPYMLSTTISNQPDYIKDYHFISLMRCIDFYSAPAFEGFIMCQADGVEPFVSDSEQYIFQQQ